MAIGLDNQLVSVIMPIHNRFNLVHEAALSVYCQTYRPIELIFVDDFSDEFFTSKIFSKQAFEVKVIRHEENKGPGASRETGRIAAHGDYIAYLDSDDLWSPQYLELQLKMLKQTPDTQMSYCKTALFSNRVELDSDNLRRRNAQTFNTILPTLFWGRPWSTSACLWTKSACDLIGPWFAGWTWEDLEYDYRAGIKKIGICHVPEVLCFKREGEGFDQLSNIPSEKEILQRFDSIMSISKAVESNKKNLDKPTLILFLKKVFRPLLTQLVQLEKIDKAQALSRRMMSVSPLFSKESGITILLLSSSKFLHVKYCKDIFLKLCNHLT